MSRYIHVQFLYTYSFILIFIFLLRFIFSRVIVFICILSNSLIAYKTKGYGKHSLSAEIPFTHRTMHRNILSK